MKINKMWMAVLASVLLAGCSMINGDRTFRHAAWGMDMDEVKSSESSDAVLIEKSKKFKEFRIDPKPEELVYTSTLFDQPVIIRYNFNRGELVTASYTADAQYYTYTEEDMMKFSKRIKEKLTAKYGQPETTEDGAVVWENKKTVITIWDEPEMGFVNIFYSSQEYMDQVNRQIEKYEEDKKQEQQAVDA